MLPEEFNAPRVGAFSSDDELLVEIELLRGCRGGRGYLWGSLYAHATRKSSIEEESSGASPGEH